MLSACYPRIWRTKTSKFSLISNKEQPHAIRIDCANSATLWAASKMCISTTVRKRHYLKPTKHFTNKKLNSSKTLKCHSFSCSNLRAQRMNQEMRLLVSWLRKWVIWPSWLGRSRVSWKRPRLAYRGCSWRLRSRKKILRLVSLTAFSLRPKYYLRGHCRKW